MAKIFLWVTAFFSFFTERDQATADDGSTYNTPLGSPCFQQHEPSSLIFIPQPSGMAKKPLSQKIPPRKEKAAVGDVSIPMPIEEPSEFLVRSSPISLISKGVLITTPIQEVCKSKYQEVINIILRNLRELELGKLVLGYAIPVAGLLVLFANEIFAPLLPIIAIALCAGFVCLWNGILLRGAIPYKLTIRLEILGVICVMFAFFLVVVSFLPPEIVGIVWISFLTFLLPLVLSFCHVKEMTLTATTNNNNNVAPVPQKAPTYNG